MTKKEREIVGDYEILRHPSGTATIYGPGIRKRGFYLETDDEIKGDYWEFVEKTGAHNGTKILNQRIKYRPLLDGELPSYSRGKQILDLPSRKYGGGKSSFVSVKDIQKTFSEFYPPELVKKFMDGEEVDLPQIWAFAKQHRRQYHAAQRTHGGLEKCVRGLGGLYVDFYRRIHSSRNRKNLDRAQVAERLLARYYAGQFINQKCLLSSTEREERDIVYQVLMIADQIGMGRNYTKTAAFLTGLHTRDIEIGKQARGSLASISENLANFLFLWAPLVGVSINNLPDNSHIPINNRAGNENTLSFSYLASSSEHKTGVADLRLGNTVIEVKLGSIKWNERSIGNLIKRYSPHNMTRWLDGQLMDKAVLIFNQKPHLYTKYIKTLTESGITIISYSEFHETLEQTVEGIKREFRRELSDIRPRIHNLDYLLDLHEEVSLKPALLLRGQEDQNVRGRNKTERRIFSIIETLGEASLRELEYETGSEKSRIYIALKGLMTVGLAKEKELGSVDQDGKKVYVEHRDNTLWQVVKKDHADITRLGWSIDVLNALIELGQKIRLEKVS